jgi:hypothetical protein
MTKPTILESRSELEDHLAELECLANGLTDDNGNGRDPDLAYVVFRYAKRLRGAFEAHCASLGDPDKLLAHANLVRSARTKPSVQG